MQYDRSLSVKAVDLWVVSAIVQQQGRAVPNLCAKGIWRLFLLISFWYYQCWEFSCNPIRNDGSYVNQWLSLPYSQVHPFGLIGCGTLDSSWQKIPTVINILGAWQCSSLPGVRPFRVLHYIQPMGSTTLLLIVSPSMWKSRRHTALLVHLWKFYTSLDADVFYIWGEFLFLLHTKRLKLGFVVDALHVSHLQTFAYDLDSFRLLAVREVISNQQHSSASQWQRFSALGEMDFGTRLILFVLGNSTASDFMLPLTLGWA